MGGLGPVVEVLKSEVASACSKDWVRRYMAEHWLIPTFNEVARSGETEFHISNIVVVYAADLATARKRLQRLAAELYEKS